MINDINIDELRLDPQTLRVSQVRLLFDRAGGSGFSVFAIVCLYAVIPTFSAPPITIGIWALAAAFMSGVTLFLPYAYDRVGGFSEENANRYLGWHTFI